MFAEIFEKRGWNVATSGDRSSAMERLAGREPYDVILRSYRVSGTTGVQLASSIRSFEHRRMTAVVMMAGKDDLTDEALAAGADEVLFKPINPNALRWVIDKLVP